MMGIHHAMQDGKFEEERFSEEMREEMRFVEVEDFWKTNRNFELFENNLQNLATR